MQRCLNAFVIYDSSGKPLVYVVKSEDFTEEEMTKLMELYEGSENAETFVTIREVV